MRNLFICAYIFKGLVLNASISDQELRSLIDNYPDVIYQDLVINDKVLNIGSNLCSNRYDIIKPFFFSLQKPFSVLEIGAAQGYFSFRLANDFPQSKFMMIDDNNSFYGHHGDFLNQLVSINNLSNVSYLRQRLDLNKLKKLNEDAHFDVVFAFLVVHQMSNKLAEKIKIFDEIFKLGDYVLVETADDVDIPLTDYIDKIARKYQAQKLATVKRFKDPSKTSLGMIYLFDFSNKSAIHKNSMGPSL